MADKTQALTSTPAPVQESTPTPEVVPQELDGFFDFDETIGKESEQSTGFEEPEQATGQQDAATVESEAPQTPEPASQDPVPTTPDPASETPSELDALKAQNAQLMQAMQSMMQGGVQQPMPQVPPVMPQQGMPGVQPQPSFYQQTAPQVLQPQQPAPAQQQEVTDYLKNVDMNTALESPEAFTSFMADFAKYITTQTQAQTLTEVGNTIPQMVTTQMAQQQQMAELRNQFYSTNKDLVPYKDFVAFNANNISAQYPMLPVDQVLAQAALVTRQTIGIPTPQQSPQTPGSPSSQLPGGTSTSRGGVPARSVTDEILELDQF